METLELLGGVIVVLVVLLVPALIIAYVFKFLSKKIKNTSYNFEPIFSKIRKVIPLPRPTEASLFVSALVLFLIAFTYSEFWDEVSYTLEGKSGGKAFIVYIYIFWCAGYSIFHAFSNKIKTEQEMASLKYFSVATLIGASISSAIYIIHTREFGFIIFSALNILQAVYLMFFSGKEYLGDKVIMSTRNADRVEIMLGTLVVFIVFGIEKYIYNTHWSILFSFTVSCWSIVAAFLQKDEVKY